MCFIYRQWDFSRAGRKSISHMESKNGTEIFCDCQPCFQAGSQTKRPRRCILTTSSHKSHYVWCQLTQNTYYFQPFQRELSPSKKRVRGTPEQHNLFFRSAFFQNKSTLQISAEVMASRSHGNHISDIPSGKSQQGSSKACFPLQPNKSKWNFLRGIDYMWESGCLRTNSLLNFLASIELSFNKETHFHWTLS